ncbi:twin transmembrane helix small protein [Kordiimonas lipolytica]|uniref:Twin transmembrane helix small protein n=1 Tax=Kordiimonas lipolytica TaxID=1662421 RepID=A0ABV8UDG8_9PROT|nr:twin transmembrane helix small protein [Kordiimonas lipolytica]
MFIFLVLGMLFMLITLFILFAGFGSMAKGGDFNKKYGNKLMQARVGAQALAIVFFALFAFTI